MSVDEVTSVQPSYAAFRVERARKRELLKHLLTSNESAQFVVFVRTKHAAGRLVKQLEENELSVLLSHNGMGKVRRSDILTAYLAGEARILVASDMALRGLEIPSGTGTVVNVDLPATPAATAQRQACMQQAQENIFLLAWDEEEAFAQLAENLQLACTVAEFAGFEPDPEAVEAEKAKQAAKEAAEAKAKMAKRPANGSHRHRAKPNGQQRKYRPHTDNNEMWRDENGDVNGNTLSSDNSNRSAIDLACEGAVLRQRRGRGNKSRPRVNGNR